MLRACCFTFALLLAPTAAAQTCAVAWLEQPAGEDYADHYPRDAFQRGIEGAVGLDCIVGEDYRLTCEVESEQPRHMGFGAASLEISRKFRVAEQTSCGQSMIGAHIRRTILWRFG